MVGQLGGVDVCAPPGGYHDASANLNLKAGVTRVDYGTALAYVRARHSLGGNDPGGDLPRILLQQAFISSVIKQVNSQGLVTNLPRLFHIAETASKSLTIDQALGSPTSLISLARSLKGLKPRNVTLLTMPTRVPTAQEIAEFSGISGFADRLMTVQPQDDVLFNVIRTGQPWTGALPVLPYSSVAVKVVNATGQPGLATRTARQLRLLGFNAEPVLGRAPFSSTTTVDYAGIAQADSAYTVMTALESFPAGLNTLSPGIVGSGGTVTLTLGADFTGVHPPKVTQPAAASSSKAASKGSKSASTAAAPNPGPSTGASAVQSRNAGSSICAGLPPALGGTG
jgi:hypothetical protein